MQLVVPLLSIIAPDTKKKNTLECFQDDKIDNPSSRNWGQTMHATDCISFVTLATGFTPRFHLQVPRARVLFARQQRINVHNYCIVRIRTILKWLKSCSPLKRIKTKRRNSLFYALLYLYRTPPLCRCSDLLNRFYD